MLEYAAQYQGQERHEQKLLPRHHGQPIEETPPCRGDAIADLLQRLSGSGLPRAGTALAPLGGVVSAWAALVGIHLVALGSPSCQKARLRERVAGLQRGKTECALVGVKCRKPAYLVVMRSPVSPKPAQTNRGLRGLAPHTTSELVEMLMDVAEAAAVGMLMRMKAMEVSITLLDATEFPYECRDTPRNQENADDHVAEDPEVEPGDRIEEPSLEIEQADKDLQQFDRSDQQR